VPPSSSPGSSCSGDTVSEPCRPFGASRQSPRYSPSSSSLRGEPKDEPEPNGACRAGLLHALDGPLERGISKRASITGGYTRIPARASMPFDGPDDRCLSRLSERSRRAPRLRRSRCSLQSAMADHRRRESQGQVGTEIVRSTIMRSGLTLRFCSDYG
jgi:hypothetical protein